MRAFPNRYLGVLALAAGLVLVACPKSWKRLDKPQTTAVWVDPEVAVPTAEEVRALTAGGELFLEYGRLEWNDGKPSVVEGKRVELPPRTPVTLVVRGEWARSFDDRKAAGKALGRELDGVCLQGESRGQRVVGIHLDLRDIGDLEAFAEVLQAVQGELAPEVFLSTSVPRQRLTQEGLKEVAEAVDFLVPQLYGQRPGTGLFDGEWTLEQTVADARRVDALGRDFLIEVRALGSVILDPQAGVSGMRTRGSLRELALSPAMELVPGFSLSGIDARRYTFRARGRVRFDGEPLALGQTLEVIGLGVGNVQDYRGALARAGLEHYRGEVFYRLPASEEHYLLSRGQMPALVRGEAPEAALTATVESRDRRGRLHRLFATVTNNGRQATEIASIDHNYLELTALDGYFSDADRGQFQRYQLLSRGGDGQTRATLRQANVLRLFQPMLDVGDQVTSGLVQMVATGADPRVRIEASFLLPDGAILTSPVTEWRP